MMGKMLLIGITICIGIGMGSFVLLIHKKQKIVPGITPASIPSSSLTQPVTSQPNTVVSDPNAKTIQGIAYLSPNPGEGLSIKYTQIVDGETYYPFQPLRNAVPPGVNVQTEIINKVGNSMRREDITPGDKLVVIMSSGPCIAGMKGGWSGCLVKIYSIQDVTR